jgi:endo-1,4-beta-xylanase
MGQRTPLQADRAVEWAQSHSMAVKGHTLCWPEHLPKFARGLPKARLREALLEHVNTTMRHYLVSVRVRT